MPIDPSKVQWDSIDPSAVKWDDAPAKADEPWQAGLGRDVMNAAAGAVRGAGSIGATLLWPIDKATDLIKGDRGPNVTGLVTGKQPLSRNEERRQQMTEALGSLGADTNSLAFGAGKMGAEISGTLGVGGALANTAARVPGVAAAAPNLLSAIRTSGMAANGANLLTRTAGGAITGGVSAGLVDPEQAGAGALIGGALPGVAKAAGMAGNAIGKVIRGGDVAPEVAGLAARAKQLGIDIPADRLVNSKPLDAIASGLNYVPLSGRAATEAKMAEQLNTAASKLMGQNTPNINKALRAASADLGAKFDTTLKSTGVAFDKQLLQDVTRVYNTAEKELGSDALKAITSQVDDLVEKGSTGMIDGQAAYNIKRTLDRIGNRNGPEAYHALELKGVLMDALNRSLGPAKAAEFATTRQQYGNMLALEKLAKNGVEGEISVARLANLKNINNQPLQELADIAAQFVKPREGQHGAMQRAVVAGTAAMAGGPTGLAALAAGGRGTNMLLNSDMARRAALGQSGNLLSANPELVQLGYKAAPIIGASR